MENVCMFNVVENTKEKITIQRYDDETKKKYTIEIENTLGITKSIKEMLSNLYIRRISDFTHLK